ncbi:MAG: hypothetical protein ACKO7P_14295 [Bacteroidota bacterium]
MKKSTPKSILLVGHHAFDHAENIENNINKQFKLNYLTYKRKDPFDDLSSNKLLINDIEIDYNGSYDLNNLTLALSFIIEHDKKLINSDIIIGDPSELLFQAFSFARLKENPLFFKQNVSRRLKIDNALNLFIYPMGMVCQDIRKEISNLIYVLKKHESKTFLLRKEEKDLDQILNNILHEIENNSIYEIEEKLEGLEHLTGKPKELFTD